MTKLFFLAFVAFEVLEICNGRCSREFADTFCSYTKREETRIGTLFRVRTTRTYYRYGRKWNQGACVECSCNAQNYTDMFTCYLEAEPGMAVNVDPPVYYITFAPTQFYHGSCPYKMKAKGTEEANVPIQFYLTYRKASTLVKYCCDKSETRNDIPDDCKAVPVDECRFELVKRENESMPCESEGSTPDS